MATIAVKDLAAAKRFYEGTLHFKRSGGSEDGVVTYQSGKSTVLVYQSDYAGTNKATSATWSVGRELDAIVRNLKDAGVQFEHYDLPGARREGDIHIFGRFQGGVVQRPRRQHPPREQRLKPPRLGQPTHCKFYRIAIARSHREVDSLR
jgi:catechol 2,3-dioxygenase-like lactoylglutathione lyase family enzyme